MNSRESTADFFERFFSPPSTLWDYDANTSEKVTFQKLCKKDYDNLARIINAMECT